MIIMLHHVVHKSEKPRGTTKESKRC